MRSPTKLLTTAFALVAVPTAASAADLVVPRQFRTIGDALAVAHAGDRIVVRGGRHYETMIDRDDVTVVGRGARLVGNTTIAGSRVALRGFEVRGTADCTSFVVTGEDVVVADNRFVDTGAAHVGLILAHADRARVEGNRLTDITATYSDAVTIRANRVNAIEVVYGVDAVVEGNRLNGGSIYVGGARAVVRGNRAGYVGGSGLFDGVVENNVTNGTGVVVGGYRLHVVGNKLTGSGISVEGDEVVVSGNTVNRSPFGVHVVGRRPQVRGNVLNVGSTRIKFDAPAYPDMPAVVVEADLPGGAVEDNRITHTSGVGMNLAIDGASVRGNTVSGVKPATSIAVVGSGNTVSGNAVVHTGGVARAGDGIAVTGDANVVADNRLTATAGNGIVVAGGDGNLLTGDAVDGTRLCGVLVSAGATGTVVADCTVTGGDVGLVNTGADTSVSGSTVVGGRVADVIDVAGFQLFDDNSFRRLSHDAQLVPKR